jgi:hypothetical protein
VFDDFHAVDFELAHEDIPDTDIKDSSGRRLAHGSGISDFYSINMLTYCQGMYTPVSRATVVIPVYALSKDVIRCSKPRALFSFDPKRAMADSLKIYKGSDRKWYTLPFPEDIQRGMKYARFGFRSAFGLYCVGIAAIFLATLVALGMMFVPASALAMLGVLLAFLATFTIFLADTILTAFAHRVMRIVNKYGKGVGIEAEVGTGFMILSWTAAGLTLLSLLMFGACYAVGGPQRAPETKLEAGPPEAPEALKEGAPSEDAPSEDASKEGGAS